MNVSFSRLNDGQIVLHAAVPEPSTLVMTTLGLVGLGLYGWRRKRSDKSA